MADSPKRTRTVRVATYNIHRGRGLDGRTRLERIASVLAAIDAGLLINFNEILLKTGLRRLEHPERYAQRKRIDS